MMKQKLSPGRHTANATNTKGMPIKKYRGNARLLTIDHLIVWSEENAVKIKCKLPKGGEGKVSKT